MIGGAVAALAVYLVAILVVAVFARRARRDDSLADFYLAGRDIGWFALLGTLFATQFSGNTLLGYPGEGYRLGFTWVMSAGFMTAIIVVYLLFVPQLYRHAKRFGYVTPADWIRHRFRSRPLTIVANVLIVVAIANYLLAQLMAMGHVVAGMTANVVPYWGGVVLLTLVILIYETAGGMRAVVWTDVAQGLLMVVGLAGMLAVVLPSPAHLGEVTAWIRTHAPEKAALPSWSASIGWLSTLLLIGVSAAVYPHAIQRVYAARSARTLRRSLCIMAFMPLVAIVPVFLIGMLSIQRLDGLDGIAADQVMPMLLTSWATESTFLYATSIMVMLAVVAAIMSTADSVLLTLSSILAKDFLGGSILAGAGEERLTRAGKLLSWAIVGVLVGIAIVPRITLWGLIELKMELLMQVSPLFLLGVTWKRLTAPAALAGMLAGLALYFLLPVAGYPRPLGFHAGVVAWGVNVLMCVVLSRPAPRWKAAAAAPPLASRT